MDCNYHFFWGGVFSQWHKEEFYVYGTRYNCAEQFMMAMKAITFNDVDTFTRIMNATEPRRQKALGREVKNFVPEVWDRLSPIIVFKGSVEKFKQNYYLLEELAKTGDKILVEASPHDKIWGIGLTEEQAKVTPRSEWPGENRLGNILTEVKTILCAELGLW